MRTKRQITSPRENQAPSSAKLAGETRGPMSWGCEGGPAEAAETGDIQARREPEDVKVGAARPSRPEKANSAKT